MFGESPESPLAAPPLPPRVRRVIIVDADLLEKIEAVDPAVLATSKPQAASRRPLPAPSGAHEKSFPRGAPMQYFRS